MKNRYWKLFGTVLLCGLFLCWLFWRDRGDGEPRVEVDSEKSPRLSALVKYPGLVGAPRVVKLAPSEQPERDFDPYEEWGTQRILDQFGVAPGSFSDASMGEVLEYLKDAFAEQGGRGVEFRMVGSGGFPITCEFGNVSASSLMDLVAGLGGYEPYYGDGEVVFRRKPPLPQLPMHEVRLGAAFLETMAGGDVSIAEKLERFGIKFDDGAQIEVEEFDDGGEMVVILNSADQNDRLLAAYQFLTDGSRLGQLLVTTKMVSVPTDQVEMVTESYQDPEFQQTIRALSQLEGANLVSAPSIVLTPGQRAKVEVIREVFIPTEWDSRGNAIKIEAENIGHSMEVLPQILGLDRIQLAGEVVHSLAEGQSLGDTADQRSDLPTVDRMDQVRRHAAEFTGDVFDGNTAGFQSAEEEGVGMQQFVTVRRIDPSGAVMLK